MPSFTVKSYDQLELGDEIIVTPTAVYANSVTLHVNNTEIPIRIVGQDGKIKLIMPGVIETPDDE